MMRACEIKQAGGVADLGAFLERDGGVALEGAFEFRRASRVRGVALHDPGVIADQSAQDSVHIATIGDFAMVDLEAWVKDDAMGGEEELGRQVVFLGVEVEGGVISSGVEERVAADGDAATDEDFRKPAGLATRISVKRGVGRLEPDFSLDGGDIGRLTSERGEVVEVERVRVVVEHDQPLTCGAGSAGGDVASGGGVVAVFEDQPNGDLVVQTKREAGGR